ncbi:MAG TPA: NifU family protein, partial [Reyranella sp.]
MFIQTEQTPNPSTLKFLPGRVVMEKGTLDFADIDSAKTSPLARRLFAIEGVERVFFGSDFVTVTKAADKDWQIMKPSILGGIMEHYTSGEPVVSAEPSAEGDAGVEDDEVVAQIKDLLETRVRPAVAQDGGDIVFQDFRDGVVYLHMQGSCSG